MANTWFAHGIIVDKRLEMPYRDAKMSVDNYGNEIDPKEHATVHLFENLFNRVLFAGDEYFVNSQVPPASKKGSEKACDIAIKYVDSNLHHRIFCFAEAKRARNNTHAKIQDMERQALGYCSDHLDANGDINLIYACTLVGASVRCWSLQRGDEFLRPFWGGTGSSYAEYLDVGEDANRDALLDAFGFMAMVPIDGALPLDMQHSDIGRVKPKSGYDSVSGEAETTTDFDYASSSAAYPGPDPVSTGVDFFSDQGAVQSTELDVNTFSNTARTIRRATSKEQSHLTADNYVAVSVHKPGRTIADTVFRLKPNRGSVMDKKGRELEQVICSTDNGDQYCWIYIGKATRRCYWTWTLDVDVKGKQVNSLDT